MKSLTVDIKDLTNSKEVYETRPHPFFAIFIYGLLAMVLGALCFMYFFKIDIVVKSDGIIRTNEDISTVTNSLTGELAEVNITDGCTVKKGDVLYVIKHDDLQLQKADIENNINKAKTELSNLYKYKDCVEKEKNLFTSDNEVYDTKFTNYYVNLMILKNDESSSMKSLSTQLESIQNKLEIYKSELNLTNKMISIISSDAANDEGVFKDNLKFSNLYSKYVSDLSSINNQYSDKAQSIIADTSGDMNAYSLKNAHEELNGYQLLLDSIKKNINQFTTESIYSLLYSQYQAKISQLTVQLERALDLYNINNALIGIGVSVSDVNSARESVNQAYAEIEAFRKQYIAELAQKINEVSNKIAQLNISKSAMISKDDLLSENEKAKNAALNSLKLQTLVNLNSQADQLNENIRNLSDNEESIIIKINSGLTLNIDGEELPVKVIAYKENEMNAVLSSIKQNTDNLTALETNLAQLNYQIENAVVCAKTDGVVNLYVDLVQGDILQSGTAVLTLVPTDTSKFKVNIYVADKDIAQLQEGMTVKYDIYALPTREYGHMTGAITNISEDLKTNSSNQSAYYLVEATLDNASVVDYEGKNTDIKVGMTCKASMITKQIRLIDYLLEQINLKD